MIHCAGMPAISYPASRLVKGAVIVGAVVAGFGLLSIIKLSLTRDAELLRYQACANGTRQDCAPSLFWTFAGLTANDADGKAQTGFTDSNATGKRVVRTSEAAPLLTSLRPDGFISQGAVGYQVSLGTEVNLLATIERASRVEVRLRAPGAATSTLLQVMTPVANADQAYEAKFRWNEPLGGELEIFAAGETVPTETTTLIVPLEVVEVANEA